MIVSRWRGYGDLDPSVSAAMDNVLGQLRAQRDNLQHDLNSTTLTVAGTADSVKSALFTASATIDFLDGDGRAKVSAGTMTPEAWVDLANSAVDLLGTGSKTLGKASIGRFATDTLKAAPGAALDLAKQGITAITGAAGEAAAAGLKPLKEYLPWVIGGLVAVGAILFLWPRAVRGTVEPFRPRVEGYRRKRRYRR